MKSPIKIILIIFAVLQLLAVLYIVLPSIPKKINEKSPGTNYVSEKLSLSFDLASDEYKINTDRENPNDGRDRLILEIPESPKIVEITRVKDEKYIEILDEKFNILQNPFKARFARNQIRTDVKERLLEGTIEGRNFEDMKIEVYKGENRRFIFTQIIFTDGHVDYTAEGKIGNRYYSIDLIEETNSEDVFRFMETATTVQN